MTSKHNKIGYNYPYGMIKHLLFILIVVLSSLQANAATKIGKIYYRLTGDSASVTYMAGSSKENANAYTGNIVIPSTVTYSGKTYRVIQIESSAFMGCNDLYSVDIPNSVKYMSGGSFKGCI